MQSHGTGRCHVDAPCRILLWDTPATIRPRPAPQPLTPADLQPPLARGAMNRAGERYRTCVGPVNDSDRAPELSPPGEERLARSPSHGGRHKKNSSKGLWCQRSSDQP